MWMFVDRVTHSGSRVLTKKKGAAFRRKACLYSNDDAYASDFGLTWLNRFLVGENRGKMWYDERGGLII